MAEPEEDFSSLPLPDRFAHKVGHEEEEDTCEENKQERWLTPA